MNDPHGIVWDGHQYHLFFQYVPGSLSWQSNLEWGHAVSPDLVHWRQIDSALSPRDEVGCWSGSVVGVDDGYLLYYTSPQHDDWSNGHVVIVNVDASLSTFERILPPSIQGAPSDQFFDFRDPQVRREQGRYLMSIGAGLKDFGGCVLQFSSDDGLSWSYDGILASRSAMESVPIETGTVWECPQFFQLGNLWCLIISSINPDSYQQVQYALGEYDGFSFEPRIWGDLGFSEIPYASTTFQDSEGNVCMMSWLRESGSTSDYAGAQSIPLILTNRNDGLRVEIHPTLNANFREVEGMQVSSHSWISLSNLRSGTEVSFVAGGTTLSISFGENCLELDLDNTIRRYSLSKFSDAAEILIDADILEVILPGAPFASAFRIPVVDVWDVRVNENATIVLQDYWGE
ncbi:MAG: Beta-fructosidase [Actinomycetota bacterium]